eukprot:1861846-Rhodomonas_salina.2
MLNHAQQLLICELGSGMADLSFRHRIADAEEGCYLYSFKRVHSCGRVSVVPLNQNIGRATT